MPRMISRPLAIALAVSISLALILIVLAVLPNWRWYHPLVHTAIEALGGLCAIVLSLVLFKQNFADLQFRFLPIAIGCLFMGVLEEFHAVSEPGNGFILLRGLASMAGSLGFALAWAPSARRETSRIGGLPWATVVCATVVGIIITAVPDRLPEMMHDGIFTPTAIALTGCAAVLFLAAAMRFAWDARQTGTSEDALFACLALVFGLAELMFTHSSLWDVRWWSWHFLRLLGYMLVLGVMVNGYQRMLVDLKDSLTHTREAEESARRSEQHLRQMLEDRERMAQDLHDGIIQSLFAQTLNLERCQRLARTHVEEVIGQLGQAVTGLKTAIRELRGYIGGLKSPTEEEQDLQQALTSQVQLMRNVSDIHVEVAVDPAATRLVSPEQATHILYIARESLSNILRHAQAQTVRLTLERHSIGVRLLVEDDGIGFETGRQQDGEGLKNMTARADKLHAHVTISSVLGSGTRVIFELPLETVHV